MAEIDDMTQIRRSLSIARAVNAGPLVTEPLEAKLLSASRQLADREAMDLEAHIMQVLDAGPQTIRQIERGLEARFLELAVARAQVRMEAGAVSGTPMSRSADRATIRAVLNRMVGEDRAWTIGWLRRRWGRYPLEQIRAARPARIGGH